MDTVTQEIVAMKPKPRTTFTMRVDESIKKALQEAADEKGKTLNGYLLWLAAKDNENVAKAILEDL